jgi:hypothetical protein
MGERYLEVQAHAETTSPWKRGERTAHQRELAERDLANVDSLAEDFMFSVEKFAAYRPRDESFHEERAALDEQWHQPGDPVTNRLAARMQAKGIKVSDDLPELRYLDRELVPSRTTSPSRFERPEGTKLRLDLLLSAGKRPVIAEVKALSDENAYYALVQGLAVCAQLTPAAQRERLANSYSGLAETGPIELWIVLADHNSRGTDKAEMLELTREIAVRLLQRPSISTTFAAINCVDAALPKSGPVSLSAHWLCSAG